MVVWNHGDYQPDGWDGIEDAEGEFQEESQDLELIVLIEQYRIQDELVISDSFEDIIPPMDNYLAVQQEQEDQKKLADMIPRRIP